MQLSILIPTIVGREEQYKSLVNSLAKQYHSGDEVKICTLRDNKEITIGEKRNKLVEMATGEYISFIDDDDRIEDDYIKELLEGIKTGADVITFTVSVSVNGAPPKPCYYSISIAYDINESAAYYRLPNHLMCVKRELAAQIKFPLINFGEDADYAKRLKPLLKTEHNIPKVLYHYDFFSNKTATQGR